MYTFIKDVTPDIIILDPTNLYRTEIRDVLKTYKRRWGSIAARIGVAHTIEEIPKGTTLIMPTYKFADITSPLSYSDIIVIDAINLLEVEDLRAAAIEVTVTYTKDIGEARQWLADLPETFTYDCEATGLEHPSREELTMYSFGINDDTAFVISNENKEMQDMVMNFLVTTEKKMIIHNTQYDMKWIKYLTGKYPKNYEDSMLAAWTYLNHSDTSKARVGLKVLASRVYRAWAVSSDLFGIEHKHNPELIHYAGVDAAATWYVWNKYSALLKGAHNETI